MDMIEENIRRNNRNHTVFNPLTGEVDILERDKFHLPDFYIPTQHLPLSMFKVKLIKLLKKYGSIKIFIESYLGLEYTHYKYKNQVRFLFLGHILCTYKRQRGREIYPIQAQCRPTKTIERDGVSAHRRQSHTHYSA